MAKKIEGIIVEEKKLGREKLYGFTFQDSIVIDPILKPQKRLEILIHEMMHQCHPKMSETNVKVSSRRLARFLWQYGYRKVDL
jgi:hypothetical protein